MVARQIDYVPTKNKSEKTSYHDDQLAGRWADHGYSSNNTHYDVDAQTELAVNEFRRACDDVKGIMLIKSSIDCPSNERTIRVEVADLLSEDTWEIIKIRSRVLQAFPDANLEIDVDEHRAR